jgi:fibronectin type 3 domain-containing protein
MQNKRKHLVTAATFICALIALSGCRNNYFRVAGPPAPPIDPSTYSVEDYNSDVAAYKTAITSAQLDFAKQKRNEIAYGLMGQIDVVYDGYYRRLFVGKSDVAVIGDIFALGLGATSTIATHAATKTLMSALGTAFTGLSLSVDKNYYAQQSFAVIGVAMQTRRDKVRFSIITNLALDTTTYPLAAVKRDLVAYISAGSLPSGLQELQEEAGVATAKTQGGSQAPSTPTNVTATPGNAQVSLSWMSPSGATSFNIYWSTTGGVSPASGTKISGITSSPYTHAGLVNGTVYYYVVTAVNAAGESTGSAQVSAAPNAAAPTPAPAAAPPAPTGLAATPGNAQASLSWTAPAGATSFNIYRSTTSGVTPANGTRIGTGLGSSPYTDTGLANGTTYYYVVTAVNSGGAESVPSAQVSAAPNAAAPTSALAAAPPAPTGLAAAPGNAQASLSWTAPAGASSFNIYRSTTSGVTPANGTRIGTGLGSSPYTDTGLANGTTYYYVVTAVNSGGTESVPSAQVSVAPRIPPQPQQELQRTPH